MRSTGRRKAHGARAWLAALIVVLPLAASAPTARAEEYEAKRAGHPVRILAYALHPVGVILDYLIFRPAHWVGHHEPFKTLFGQEDD
jgi:hypothetical protein